MTTDHGRWALARSVSIALALMAALTVVGAVVSWLFLRGVREG